MTFCQLRPRYSFQLIATIINLKACIDLYEHWHVSVVFIMSLKPAVSLLHLTAPTQVGIDREVGNDPTVMCLTCIDA